MRIADQVEMLIDDGNIAASPFYMDCQKLMEECNKLIGMGVTKKRESQLCSVEDKLRIIASNCNYNKSVNR